MIGSLVIYLCKPRPLYYAVTIMYALWFLQEFRHDRFVDATFYKDGREVKNPVLAFGSLCPGQRFATLELKWYIMSVFSKLQLQLTEGVSAEYDYQYHGHEVLPPVQDIPMRYRQRQSPVQLRYEA